MANGNEVVEQPRRLETVELNSSDADLMLAVSPILTSGYYSESLSQSVSARLPREIRRQDNPPPTPQDPREEGVVIEAGMSFVMAPKSASHHNLHRPTPSYRRVGVSHHFRPLAAHTVTETHSSALSNAIHEFLSRTDHVMNEWKRLGKEDPGRSIQRSRSTTRSLCLPARKTTNYRSSSVSSRYTKSCYESGGTGARRVPSFHSVHSSGSKEDVDWHSAEDSEFFDIDDTNDEVSVSFILPATNRDAMNRSTQVGGLPQRHCHLSN